MGTSGKAYKKKRNLDIIRERIKKRDLEAKKAYEEHIEKLKTLPPNEGFMLYEDGVFSRWTTPIIELAMHDMYKSMLENNNEKLK